MAVICPTVTAFDTHAYREQMERVAPFATRIHIDLMDGEFASTKSPDLEQIWWPHYVQADIHLMYQKPMDYLALLIKLNPRMVIIHSEADVDLVHFAAELHKVNILAGLALLQDSSAESAFEIMRSFDQILVFSGSLGRHGGIADLGLLGKVQKIKAHYPEKEIAWDGGIDDQNAAGLIEAGVDVLNVGGFIQKSEDPKGAYDKLLALIKT